MPGGPMGGPRRGQTTAKAKDFKNTTKKLINLLKFISFYNMEQVAGIEPA